MRRVAIFVAVLVACACGRRTETARPTAASASTPVRSAAASAATSASASTSTKVAPYVYKAPVSGKIHEANVGRFELVDGVAYSTGAGTVVFASSKPIASPVLAGSPCPMTDARALEVLRDASWAEVTIDDHAKSPYFGYGRAFGASGFDETGGHEWATQVDRSVAGRIRGTAYHRDYGGFSFELPLAEPRFREVSEKDRSDGRRSDPAAPRPEEGAVTAAYRAVRSAALAGDLDAVLAAQGFSEKARLAIRGLDGIDADLGVFADRFLHPGDPTPGEFTSKPGTAYVRTEGVNRKGKKFASYYHFNSCGDRLVLVAIAENPQ